MSHLVKPLDLTLHEAIRENNLSKLQQFIDSLTPEDLHDHLNEDDCDWGMPLHVAVMCNNQAAVEILLKAGASPLRARLVGDDPPVPISVAAQQGNRAILRQLCQYIDPDHQASDYRNFQSCLVYAAIYGQVSVVADLLDWWSGWSSMAKEEAVIGAAMRWRLYVVELLLSKFSFDQQTLDRVLYRAVNSKSQLGSNWHVTYEGVDYFEQQQLIALVVDAGANPNTTLDGTNLIKTAAYRTNLVGGLKVLLEKGADPNATNEEGNSALHRLGFPVLIDRPPLKRALHEAGIRLLIEKNASVCLKNKAGETPIHYAAWGSNQRILQLYLSAYPSEDERNALIRSTSHHGESLLHFAAAGCKLDIIEYLFSHAGMEPNINEANSNGWTPLMCALARTSELMAGYEVKELSQAIRATHLLLAHGANPLVNTAEGWTPLHCLGLYLGEDIDDEARQLIDLFISAGADVNARALFPVETSPASGRPSALHDLGLSSAKLFGWGRQVDTVIKDPASYGMMIRSGLTPLHFAATYGALGVVEALLRNGANPAAEDFSGTSPARTAGESTRMTNYEEIQDKIITLLMDTGGSY